MQNYENIHLLKINIKLLGKVNGNSEGQLIL